MKKKILYMVPLMVMALGLASCDPSHDDEGPNASVTSDELTQEVRITAKSEGNNNLTIITSANFRYSSFVQNSISLCSSLPIDPALCAGLEGK